MEKTQIILLSLLALATISGVTLFYNQHPMVKLQQSQEAQIYQAYNDWKFEFAQRFTNGQEDANRFSQFRENYLKIQEFNAENEGTVLALNQFAAMTNEQFRKISLGYKKNKNASNKVPSKKSIENLPEQVDWRNKGAVAPVLNQGDCGGCWAFGSVAALEGLNEIKNGKLVPLSPQQLISCAPAPEGYPEYGGCEGSNAETAFDYTQKFGVNSLARYPYANQHHAKTVKPCKYLKDDIVFTNTGGYGEVEPKNIDQIKSHVSEQPLAIGVNGGSFVFQFYRSGILKSKNCGNREDQLDHEIALVGYNATDKDPYWIVKNSWGTTWGLQGFGKFAIVEGNGICGVQLDLQYPIA